MAKERILYVCTGHGDRARIAEYYTQQQFSPFVEAFSASFEPGLISGLPNIIMQEEGCSTPLPGAESLFERFANNDHFDHIVTMCDDFSNEQCPLFRNCVSKLYRSSAQIHAWSIPDFRTLSGNGYEQLDKARAIRALIQHRVEEFVCKLVPVHNLQQQQHLWP